MKKCPYCAEEIQDVAVKCKHCNEWLDKKSNIKSIFLKAKSFVDEKRTQYIEKKNSHLYLPTEENPLIIEGIRLYPDRFEYRNRLVSFNNIYHINFYSSQSSLNGINTSNYMTFEIFIKKDISDETLENISIIDSFGKGTLLSSNISKKTKQQLFLMKNFISKVTLKLRLVRYLNELQEKNYFTYNDIYKFYQNGDIEEDGKIKANIREAFQNELIDWGAPWKGLRSSSFDPYEFIINKNHGIKVKFGGFESGCRIKVYTTLDNDIFNLLIISFLKDGTFFPGYKENTAQ